VFTPEEEKTGRMASKFEFSSPLPRLPSAPSSSHFFAFWVIAIAHVFVFSFFVFFFFVVSLTHAAFLEIEGGSERFVSRENSRE